MPINGRVHPGLTSVVFLVRVKLGSKIGAAGGGVIRPHELELSRILLDDIGEAG
jgi:hypothetical protein